MRNYLPLLGGLSLLLSFSLLGSCSQPAEFDDGALANFGDEVSFSTPATRVSDDQWEDDDRVGLFAGASLYTNIQYNVESASGALTPVGDKIYYLSNDEVTYYAYYPYQSGMSGTNYTINLTDQSDLSKIDLMWGKSVSSTSEVELLFEHKLSKISLSVVDGEGNTLPADLTCSIYGMGAAATFNITSGSISSQYDGTIKGVKGEISSDGKRMSYEMLMLPSTSLDDLMFLLGSSSEGKSYLYIPSKDDRNEITEWESGLSYPYEARVVANSSTEVDVESVSLDVTQMENMAVQQTLQLVPTITPSYATNVVTDWTSSNNNVATVSSSGLVEIVGVGSATITLSVATSSGTPILATCEVTSKLSVGDYIYKGMKSYGTATDILGVVYSLNDDGESGIIVDLGTGSAGSATTTGWATGDFAAVETGAQDISNGLSNMRNVLTTQPSLENYPPFSYCHAMNTTLNSKEATYTDGVEGEWYLPSQNEAKALLTAIFGSDYTATSLINTRIGEASGTAFKAGSDYFTSTENSNYNGTDFLGDTNFQYARFNTTATAATFNTAVTFGSVKSTKAAFTRVVMNFTLADDNQ